jgi:hypothetical protein
LSRDAGFDTSLDTAREGARAPSPAERDPPRWDSPVREARCPVCGRAYRIPLGFGRELMTTKFLAHKDGCTPPRRWEYARVKCCTVRVVGADRRSEEFPVYTVRYPSGREGAYRACSVTRCPDQARARERFAGGRHARRGERGARRR